MVKEQEEGKLVEAKRWRNQNKKTQENNTDTRKRKTVPIGNDGAEEYLLLVAPPPPLVYILKERVWIWER
jgi:hypothetical protein